MVKTVFFDVGETLFDETRLWERAADTAGVPRFTLMGILGGLAARGEPHSRVWELLGASPGGTGGFRAEELYPDALPCLAALREDGYRIGAVGNTDRTIENVLRPFVDFVGSSQRWGVSKPEPAFFARVAEEAAEPPGEIAYVGDRVDNDVLPALAAGMVAVHVRRGPWGHLHEPPPVALQVRSLGELPEALRRV